jgi:predicted acylesterase/phospholipase RssA
VVSRASRVFAAIIGLSLLAGCVATERKLSEAARVGSHWASVQLFDDRSRVLTPAERAEVAKSDLNILALSGGGADGAFGAGLLVGWTESGKRPQFDIVTGVSTGALMATFAFMGPSADPLLEKFYTTTTTSDVFTTRGLEGVFTDSLYDTTPLKAKITTVVTDEVLAAVAAEHRKGRRLYVATTNLDAGTVTVWNMGAIAASGQPESLELYREIIRASAAVPAFFKPVLIQPAVADANGAQMHVDGGVKAPILVRTFMLNGPYKRKNVYIIVNGPLKLRSSAETVPANLTGIARKSITELLRGLMYKTIYQAYVSVRHAGANFNLAFVPDDAPDTKDPLNFEPAEMRRMFEIGRELGRSGKSWHNEPPRLEQLERVTPVRTRPAMPVAAAAKRTAAVQ